jgi:hypothetical protein
MKSIIINGLAAISEHPAWQNICRDEFICGIIFGIAGYLVLLMMVHIVFLICRRRKKCVEMTIDSENGSIRFSLKAVAAILKKELTEFTQVEILKIAVYKHKNGYIMDLRGKFQPGESGAPELYAAMVTAIKLRMQEIFGVDNIVKVNLLIDKSMEENSADADTGMTEDLL